MLTICLLSFDVLQHSGSGSAGRREDRHGDGRDLPLEDRAIAEEYDMRTRFAVRMKVVEPSTFSILQFRLGGSVRNIGILVRDAVTNRLFVRMADDFPDGEGVDAEFARALASDVIEKGAEMGADQFLKHLEDTLSNALTITDRQPIASTAHESVEDLFSTYVQATR